MIVLTATPMSDFLTNATQFFSTFVSGATKVAELFTVWPVNLFLGVTILGVGVGLIKAFAHR